MSEPVHLERSGAIAIVTLARPETRNALDDEMVGALVATAEAINADASIACAIVTAEGPSFCAGGNVKDMVAGRGMFAGSPAEMREAYRRNVQRIPLAVFGIDVPTIAAVNGPAIGAGCDLAMMCDLRIAADSAVFAESFVRLGLVAGDGGALAAAAGRRARARLRNDADGRSRRRREGAGVGSCVRRAPGCAPQGRGAGARRPHSPAPTPLAAPQQAPVARLGRHIPRAEPRDGRSTAEPRAAHGGLSPKRSPPSSTSAAALRRALANAVRGAHCSTAQAAADVPAFLYQGLPTRTVMRAGAISDLPRKLELAGIARATPVCGPRTARSDLVRQVRDLVGPTLVVSFDDVAEHSGQAAVERAALYRATPASTACLRSAEAARPTAPRRLRSCSLKAVRSPHTRTSSRRRTNTCSACCRMRNCRSSSSRPPRRRPK